MSKVHKGGVLYINGVPAAHAGPGGFASAKEECWVTVAGKKVKKIFVNRVVAKDLKGTTARIFYNGHPLATTASFTGKSYGDEGSEGGVKSGTKLAEGRFLSGSPNVRLEGSQAVRHGDKIILNAGNSEITSWVQGTSVKPAMAKIISDPIEVLPNPKTLNIELVRSPVYNHSPVTIQQFFRVTHEETGHKRNSSYTLFKPMGDAFLWHADTFREGTYTVEEFYQGAGDIMRIPLGKIKTCERDSLVPAMKLMPLSFKRYDDTQHSGDGAKKLYKNTYLYLFKDGHLWRVFHMNHLESLYEIDLARKRTFSDADEGEIKQGVLLPIQDAQGQHTFHVTVSTLPFSWEYVHKLGGLAPDDPRFTAKDYLGIAPDATLIQKRLQPIPVNELLRDEGMEIIPEEQTEYAAFSRYPDEPHDDNHDWLTERGRFAHSQGVKRYQHHLQWHHEERPAAATRSAYLNEVIANHDPVQGCAIMLIHDPLGRLIFTAQQLLARHHHFNEILESDAKAYALAKIVGQVLDTSEKQGKNYEEKVRNDERLEFITQYEKKQAAHQAMLRRGVDLVKFWYEQTEESGQWEDFFSAPLSKKNASYIANHFEKLEETIHGALTLNQTGHNFLQQRYDKGATIVERSITFTEAVLKFEPVTSLGYNTVSTLTSLIKPDTVGFERVVTLIEKFMGYKSEATLVDVSVYDMLLEHRDAKTQKAFPVIVRIQKGTVERKVHHSYQKSKNKTVRFIKVHQVPVYEFKRLIPGGHSPLVTGAMTDIHKLSTLLDRTPSFHGVMSIMSILQTKMIIEQMKASVNAENELDISLLLYAELMENVTYIVFFSGKVVETTIGFGKAVSSKVAEKVLKHINIAAIFLGVGIDAYKAIKAIDRGEYGLATMQALSVGMGLGMAYGTWAIGTVLGASILLFSTIVFFLALAVIILLTNTPIEEWLFVGHWGTTDDDRVSMDESIATFNDLTTLAQISKIDAITAQGHEIKPIPINHPEFELGHISRTTPDMLRLQINVPEGIHLTIHKSVTAYTPWGQKELELYDCEIIPGEGQNYVMRIKMKDFLPIKKAGLLEMQIHDESGHAFIKTERYQIQYNIQTDIYKLKRLSVNDFREK